jgi:hypothetical protein
MCRPVGVHMLAAPSSLKHYITILFSIHGANMSHGTESDVCKHLHYWPAQMHWAWRALRRPGCMGAGGAPLAKPLEAFMRVTGCAAFVQG